MQGGIQVIIPHTPIEIPNPARQEQTAGGNPKVKQPPTAVPVPPTTAPTAAKQAEQARGPDYTRTIVSKSRITKKKALSCLLNI